jgi:flagellar motor switch protein FliM
MADQDNILSPEELDALVSDPKLAIDLVSTVEQRNSKALKYDIASETASLNFNLDPIHRINQLFEKKLQQGLASSLKSRVEVDAKNTELVSFGKYFGQTEVKTAANIIALEPLRGRALVVIEMPVLRSALSNFFGGSGLNIETESSSIQFTATEMTIKNIMLGVILDSIREAWAPVLSLKPSFIGLETEIAHTKIIPPLNTVVLNRFSITIGGSSSGNIDIVYPYSMLRLISENLTQWAHGSINRESSHSVWRTSLSNAVAEAPVKIRVELGKIHLTLKEFEMLREDEVVMFKKPHYARASADGIPIFEGNVGSQSSQMAVQIVRSFEVPE